MGCVLIVGAKSDIAMALAHEYAGHGYDLYLAARNAPSIAKQAQDLRIRYSAKVEALDLDLTNYASHFSFYSSLKSRPEVVIMVTGYLGNQKKAESDFNETMRIMETNYCGCVSLLNIVANDFEQRNAGSIVGISSVASDRGRKSNYLYGSAKAAFSEYLSGLRNRLSGSGVHVLTVKPGFVHTRMTRGMDLPGRLTASSAEAAQDIFAAQQKRKDVLYTKWFWRYIMLIIRHIPESIFKKMNL